jgi:hypothetical protein
VQGAGDIVVSAVTVDGAGVAGDAISGSGDITTGPVEVAGVGTVKASGSGDIQVGSVTVDGAGSVNVPGSGDITLGAITVSGFGVVGTGVVGSGAVATGSVEVDGQGAITVSGTGDIQAGSVTVTGSGLVSVVGQGAITLGAPEFSGSGQVSLEGQGAIAIGSVTVDGSGLVAGDAEGPGDIVIPKVAVDGSGTVTVQLDMFAGQLRELRRHLSDQPGIQEFLQVTTSAEASKKIFLYEFPLDTPGRFLMIDRGQNWAMNRERVNSPSGRHFSKSGTFDLYWKAPIECESPEVEATERIMGGIWASVAGIMDAIDAAPKIQYEPADILMNAVDLTQWWRPTQDDAESEGDSLEGIFTIAYGTGA